MALEGSYQSYSPDALSSGINFVLGGVGKEDRGNSLAIFLAPGTDSHG